MKSFAIILAFILVVYQVDASEEEEGGDINIVIEQQVQLPGPPDVDECFEDIDTCADNELCVNNPGSYTCICADGYEKVKSICEDVDECSKDVAVCGDFSECINIVGSFSCKCTEGFEDVEGFCEDIDECSANENPCWDNSECVNNIGNFTCNCNEGFEEVDDICKDIDECNADNILCGDNEVCRNSIGSYTCICESGYADIGSGCENCIINHDTSTDETFEWTTPNYPDNYPEDTFCSLKIKIPPSSISITVTVTVKEPGKIHDSSNNNDCKTSSDRFSVDNRGIKATYCGDLQTGLSWTLDGDVNEAKSILLAFQSNSVDEASAKGIKFEIEITKESA